MNKKQLAIKTAKEVVNLAIKNSDIVAPYVKPKHYRRGLAVLNGVYVLLRVLDKE